MGTSAGVITRTGQAVGLVEDGAALEVAASERSRARAKSPGSEAAEVGAREGRR
jgi:hypothetical protein